MRAFVLALLAATTLPAETLMLPGKPAGDPIPSGYSITGTYLVVRQDGFHIEVNGKGDCHMEIRWHCPGDRGQASHGDAPPGRGPGDGAHDGNGGGNGGGPGDGGTPPGSGTPGPGCIPVPTRVCKDARTTYDMPVEALLLERDRCYYVGRGTKLEIGRLAGLPAVRWIKLRRGAKILASESTATLVLDTQILRRAVRRATFRKIYAP
jgi:hypothetical protein